LQPEVVYKKLTTQRMRRSQTDTDAEEDDDEDVPENENGKDNHVSLL
jgi:hypothetical protein